MNLRASLRQLHLILAFLIAPALVSADPYYEFQKRISADFIKPFALDLGGLLGASSFYDGRSLGTPGFRFDAMGVIQSHPDKNNRALRDADVRTIALPMVEAAIGLPYKIDVMVHGMHMHGLTIIGGGFRYGLYKSGLVDKFIPNVGLSFQGDKATHAAFSAEHMGATAALSWNLPFVSPFLWAGGDWTRFKVDKADTAGVTGLSATASGSRAGVGLDIKPVPMIRLHAAYLLLHGIGGAQVGLGVQF